MMHLESERGPVRRLKCERCKTPVPADESMFVENMEICVPCYEDWQIGLWGDGDVDYPPEQRT